MESCIFCNIEQGGVIPPDKVVANNNLALAILDGYPVSEGHTLFIPRRHVETWFELTTEERGAIDQMLIEQKRLLEQNDPTIKGFNIGMNCGEAAGQTVMHCHVHLIPRRKGDVDEPRGGVRGVIPNKREY